VPIYCLESDVARHAGGAKALTELADNDGDATNDSGLVDSAIDAAEAVLNSYARKLYEVPFDPVPPSIREMTAGLAVYELKCWKPAGITDIDQVKQDARLEWLTNLARGIVDPGITPAPATSGHVVDSNTARPDSKRASRDALKGAW